MIGMSAKNLEDAILQIRTRIGFIYLYKQYRSGEGQVITKDFLQDVSLLQSQYGKYIGKIKAANKGDSEVDNNDAYISRCFEGLLETANPDKCFQSYQLSNGQNSQLITYTQTLESLPKDVVPKALFDQAVIDRQQYEKTAQFLARHGTMPEINL
jgi:hypothetical protein